MKFVHDEKKWRLPDNRESPYEASCAPPISHNKVFMIDEMDLGKPYITKTQVGSTEEQEG